MPTTLSSRVQRRPRTRLAFASAALVFALPLALGACSKDDNKDTASDVSAAISDAATDASNAADSAVADISQAADSLVPDSKADEGIAKNLANQVKTKLDAMANPGEPIIKNINDATTGIVTAPNRVTGLDDSDNDGKDDDAKFTIETNGGKDKACVQSQNAKWEVTDDEC